MPNHAKFKIGAFVLDPSRNVLIGAGGESALEPKLVDVLVALAAKPGTVLSRDELIDTVWKTEFGADERLTRAISQLRKAFHDERGAAQYIETVSKRGYRLVAVVEHVAEGDCAPAVVIAEPPPSLQTVPSAPIPPASSRAWRGTAVAAFLGLIGAAAIAATVWRGPSATSPYTQDLVELRPFVVIDGKPGMDAFARQVGASLKRILASNQVTVVERGTERPAGADEGAASEFIMSGVVERSGEAFAVTLYLDNRADSQTVWSRRFAREVPDDESLREEIGANAAFTIACSLRHRAAARVKPTTRAFKVYLESCDPTRYIGSNATHVMAERVIAAAPDDAYGYGLAAIANAESSGSPELSQSEAEGYRAAARKAAARALEIEPSNPYASIATAMLAPRHRWGALDANLLREGMIHPCLGGYYVAGLRTSGRLREALEAAERAHAAAPLYVGARNIRAIMHMHEGRHAVADRLFEETLRLWPDNRNTLFFRFVNMAFYGDPEKASIELASSAEKMEFDADGVPCWKAFIHARARADGEGAKATRAGCERYAANNVTRAQYHARMLSALGDVDGAYQVVHGASFNWTGATTFLFYPEMAAFRADARFMPFIADSGLLDYWTESGRWPDFCSDRTLSYDCETAAARALKDRAGPALGTKAAAN